MADNRPEFTKQITSWGEITAGVRLQPNGILMLMKKDLLEGGRELLEYEIIAMQAFGAMEALELIKSKKQTSHTVDIKDNSEENSNRISRVDVIWDRESTELAGVYLHNSMN